MGDPKKDTASSAKQKDSDKRKGTKYPSKDTEAETEKDFIEKLDGKLRKKGF